MHIKLHGSGNINEKSHACLAKCLYVKDFLLFFCFVNFRRNTFRFVVFSLIKETSSKTTIHPFKVV